METKSYDAHAFVSDTYKIQIFHQYIWYKFLKY